MLGIFKKFWKTEEANVVTVPPTRNAPARPAASPFAARPATPAPPAARPAAPTVAVTARSAPLPVPSVAGSVTVMLGAVEPSLPEPLRHKIAGALQELVSIPINKL